MRVLGRPAAVTISRDTVYHPIKAREFGQPLLIRHFAGSSPFGGTFVDELSSGLAQKSVAA
jgi:hypothetical protein